MPGRSPLLDITADDLRLLDRDEARLVEIARGNLGDLGHSELTDTQQRLRDRRDRARELAKRQAREARGKADPAGSSPATRNEGNEAKARILGWALDRLAQERDRRAGDGEQDQHAMAERALAMKRDGATTNPEMEDGGPLDPEDPDADPGKGPLSSEELRTAPSGALDHEGRTPARYRSKGR